MSGGAGEGGPGGDDRVPCPRCGRAMRFTGLPDLAGPVYFRVYRCRDHGPVRVPVHGERPDGWG